VSDDFAAQNGVVPPRSAKVEEVEEAADSTETPTPAPVAPKAAAPKAVAKKAEAPKPRRNFPFALLIEVAIDAVVNIDGVGSLKPLISANRVSF